MKKPTVISIANTKGGTGKTTTCLNLSTSLSSMNYRILLIDLDAQGSLSKAIIGENNLIKQRGIEVLLVNPTIEVRAFITETKINNVDIMISHSDLLDVSIRLMMNANFFVLKDIVKKIGNDYDFILIDNAPSKTILMLNSFIASDKIIIPCNPGKYPLMDIAELEQSIKSTSMNSNPELDILGVLITMTARGTVYKQLEDDLRKYFGEKVFETTISRGVKSEESAIEGVGITELDPECKLSQEYKALTLEIIDRLRQSTDDRHSSGCYGAEG